MHVFGRRPFSASVAEKQAMSASTTENLLEMTADGLLCPPLDLRRRDEATPISDLSVR